MTRSAPRLFAALALGAAALAPAAGAQDAPTRAIEHIAGDVYRFQNDFHYSVFMATPEGVIATDPINADAARWLEDEIRARFGAEIRYLVYSHDHADHIAGGEVFADTATVVAHERAKRHIVAENRPTAVPDITFADAMTLTLGGKTVELKYLGRNHGDSLIVMRFPEERILFAVDIVAANRLPFRYMRNNFIDEWIEALKTMERMDFDILVPGHGEVGARADIAPHREYVERLSELVLAGMRAGKSVDELKDEIGMDAYSAWGGYDAWRALNIEGMHRWLSRARRGN